MGTLRIVYKELENASDYAKKVASKCDDYYNELGYSFTNNVSMIPDSPLSSKNQRTDEANYYVKMKREKLKAKSTAFASFATAIDTFEQKAKDADSNVAKTVNNTQKEFYNKHKNLSGDGWAAFFAAISVNVPILGAIFDHISEKLESLNDLANNIRHWYELEGGKEIIDTALAIGEVVLAVAGLIIAIASPACFLVMLAGVVSACIALVDAGVNLYNQLEANKQTDPAWAKYYGSIDDASTTLRKKTFDNKLMNKWSGAMATGLDIVKVLCDVVSIGKGLSDAKVMYSESGLKSIFSKQTKILGENGHTKVVYKFSMSEFKTAVMDKERWGDIGKCIVKILTKDPKNVESTPRKIVDIAKSVKKYGGMISKTAKVSQRIGEDFVYGLDGKNAYKNVKDMYSVFGGKGLINTGFKTYDTFGKMSKLVKV